MSDLVNVFDEGPLREIALNRPEKRNALNLDLLEALDIAVGQAAEDSQVRCVILRGEGPVFSSGMDLGSLSELAGSPEALRPFREKWLATYNLLEQMAKPTICQIHGACIGGAAELALACDLRTMAIEAVIGLPEVKLGLIPDLGGCSRLTAVVGVGRAKELIMTGRMIGAEDAHTIGLVNRIAPEHDLQGATRELAAELLQAAPLAAGRAKRVIDLAAKPALAESLEAEIDTQESLVTTEDFSNGIEAFLNKQEPGFKGQ